MSVSEERETLQASIKLKLEGIGEGSYRSFVLSGSKMYLSCNSGFHGDIISDIINTEVDFGPVHIPGLSGLCAEIATYTDGKVGSPEDRAKVYRAVRRELSSFGREIFKGQGPPQNGDVTISPCWDGKVRSHTFKASSVARSEVRRVALGCYVVDTIFTSDSLPEEKTVKDTFFYTSVIEDLGHIFDRSESVFHQLVQVLYGNISHKSHPILFYNLLASLVRTMFYYSMFSNLKAVVASLLSKCAKKHTCVFVDGIHHLVLFQQGVGTVSKTLERWIQELANEVISMSLDIQTAENPIGGVKGEFVFVDSESDGWIDGYLT